MWRMPKGKLYVVATPIGNLDDISRRAIEVLSNADVVAAEDTRRTRVLLKRFGLDRPLLAVHEHNEEQAAPGLVKRMRQGESVALVSDAGTPLLSDPGFRLLQSAVAAGVQAVAVPGPSALTAALSVSGLPTDRFIFEGFLPSRPSARRKKLETLQSEPRTLVFFESSHRVQDSLADLAATFGAERQAAVCRELTKQFETVLRGSLDELLTRVVEDADHRKGEFVVVVAGCSEAPADKLPDALQLARQLKAHLGASQAARVAAKIHDVSRRDVYAQLEQDK